MVSEVSINAICQMYQLESHTTSACWQLLVKPYPSHGSNEKWGWVAGWPNKVSVTNDLLYMAIKCSGF